MVANILGSDGLTTETTLGALYEQAPDELTLSDAEYVNGVYTMQFKFRDSVLTDASRGSYFRVDFEPEDIGGVLAKEMYDERKQVLENMLEETFAPTITGSGSYSVPRFDAPPNRAAAEDRVRRDLESFRQELQGRYDNVRFE